MIPALLASAALAAALFASRLPPGPDFILPRRGGYALFASAWALFSRPWGRAAFSALVSLAFLAAAALLARSLRRAVKTRPRGAAAAAGLALGPAFAALLSWRLFGRTLDLVQTVWFPYESMDAREPFAAAALFAAFLLPACAASRAWVAGRRKTASQLVLVLVALELVLAVLGGWYGVGEPLPSAGPASKTAYVVLTQTAEGPGREVFVLSPGAFGDDPRPAYHRLLSGPRGARTVPALRALYQAEAMRWDASGLRHALLLGGAMGDGLARSLLLSHLESAPPSDEAVAALGALADEDAYRVGPLGAARVARAYAHLGRKAEAAAWAAKAASAIPPGLLGLESGETAPSGRISGRVSGPPALRAALYRRPDPAAPQLLDAGGFVAAAEPDAAGRFRFAGLPPGRYYLAFAFPAGPEGLRGEVSVSGHRGDIVLAARRSADLPPLTLKLSTR